MAMGTDDDNSMILLAESYDFLYHKHGKSDFDTCRHSMKRA